jgi:hypothetical protein
VRGDLPLRIFPCKDIRFQEDPFLQRREPGDAAQEIDTFRHCFVDGSIVVAVAANESNSGFFHGDGNIYPEVPRMSI